MRRTEAARPSAGRFAYDGLDRVIHERARLSVLTSLITHAKGQSFGELKRVRRCKESNTGGRPPSR